MNLYQIRLPGVPGVSLVGRINALSETSPSLIARDVFAQEWGVWLRKAKESSRSGDNILIVNKNTYFGKSDIYLVDGSRTLGDAIGSQIPENELLLQERLLELFLSARTTKQENGSVLTLAPTHLTDGSRAYQAYLGESGLPAQYGLTQSF